MKRAVITGLGIVSSIGNNQQEVLASLQQGRSGIAFSQEFADMGLRSQVWGQINIDTAALIDRKALRFMGDAAAYAYISMQQAIEDAGLTPEQVSNFRTGLVGQVAPRQKRKLKRQTPCAKKASSGLVLMPCLRPCRAPVLLVWQPHLKLKA